MWGGFEGYILVNMFKFKEIIWKNYININSYVWFYDIMI